MHTSVTAVQGLTTGLLLIFLLTGKIPLVWFAILLLFIQQLFPKVAEDIGSVLHQVMRRLGALLVFVVLSVLYFVLVTPYAVIYRFFHKEETNIFEGRAKAESYFVTNARVYDRAFFEKPW